MKFTTAFVFSGLVSVSAWAGTVASPPPLTVEEKGQTVVVRTVSGKQLARFDKVNDPNNEASYNDYTSLGYDEAVKMALIRWSTSPDHHQASTVIGIDAAGRRFEWIGKPVASADRQSVFAVQNPEGAGTIAVYEKGEGKTLFRPVFSTDEFSVEENRCAWSGNAEIHCEYTNLDDPTLRQATIKNDGRQWMLKK